MSLIRKVSSLQLDEGHSNGSELVGFLGSDGVLEDLAHVLGDLKETNSVSFVFVKNIISSSDGSDSGVKFIVKEGLESLTFSKSQGS